MMGEKTQRPRAAKGPGRVWRRPPASLMVLLLGILLLLGAAWQALGTGRSQERTVTRVLQSYASVAAWNFEQQANPVLHQGVEAVFHRPLHNRSFEDGATGPIPAGALLTDGSGLDQCAREILSAAKFAAAVALHSDAVDTSAPLDDATGPDLAAELRSHYRRTPAHERVSGNEYMHAFTLRGSDVIVFYLPKPVPGDTLLYALVVDPAGMTGVFDRLARAGRLLPEPLLDGVRQADLLSVALLLPGSGRLVYGALPGTDRIGSRVLSKLGGLSAVVELKPGAEAHLILGDSPLTGGPFLVAILVLAIGLLIIAYSQIRREYALSRMRSDFVSSVSHELRTPLALQRVFLDMLRLGRVTTDDKRQWCFDNIDRESVRLAHLVENVLHFSRAEQGTMRVCAERARLAPVVEEIIRGFEPLAAVSSAALTVQLDPTVTAPVDARALRQVLMNLLENAVKYGSRGGAVDVVLQFDNGVARITIDDTGSGVPVDEREAIFEPYRRGRGTFNTAIAGSGIGLAVVRELVRGHGGRVFVTDAPTGGARFVIELPDARRTAADHHRAERRDAGHAADVVRRPAVAARSDDGPQTGAPVAARARDHAVAD